MRSPSFSCDLRSILAVTDFLPMDTSASGLKGKAGGEVPGEPEPLHFFLKESCA